ncbi:MAG: glycosyltransferase, partial [Bacteroidota bacterium]
TKALLKCGVDLIFVVPKAFGDEKPGTIRLVNASDVAINVQDEIFNEYVDHVSYVEVDSALIPYADDEQYYHIIESIEKGFTSEKGELYTQKYSFEGGYGKNLMEEVKRYAMIALEIARQHDFDLIHAHDWLTYMAGKEAKKISGKPLIVHMHATEFDRSGENVNTLVYEIEKAGMEAADKVIAVSHLTRNTVIQRYGINPDKVVTVHNGVEPSEKESKEEIERHLDEKIVTFLGRITFQKGPEYFIEAAYKVLQRDSNVRFVMAGSGDMLPKMIRRVARLGIANKFHFTGFLMGDDVDKMFGLSDVYVMPSVSEPFGISPLEAMRSNVPVIISKQSGVAEVLRHAIKINFWDVDAMADAIYALIHYEALPEIFKKHGKEEVDNIKWDQAGVKVKDIYQSFLS